MGALTFDAIVVGAGPVGLACALGLRQQGARVALVDRSADPAQNDPERGFVYLVDGRGQPMLRELGLFDALVENGVDLRQVDFCVVSEEEGVKTMPRMSTLFEEEANQGNTSYWITRSAFVGLLDTAVRAAEGDDSGLPAIARFYDVDVARVRPIEGDACWAVTVDDGTELRAPLLVGSDGINSAVRGSLGHVAAQRGRRGAFHVRRGRSPAAGLRYKVLQLPPDFTLPDGSRPPPEGQYAFSAPAHVRPPVRFGMLPIRSGPRTANIITTEHHAFWEQKTADAMRAYLRASFPQAPLDLVGDSEISRFAASPGGRFPRPQHATDAAIVVGKASAVLAGDALHAFPPDLGQGVNSGLQDAQALLSTLRRHGVTFPLAQSHAESDGGQAAVAEGALGRAVREYGEQRLREARALVRLMRIGAPWQYRQVGAVAKIRRQLWLVNVLLRSALHKAFGPTLGFHRQVVGLIQEPSLSYSEIERRGDMTSRRIAAALVLVAWGLRSLGSLVASSL